MSVAGSFYETQLVHEVLNDRSLAVVELDVREGTVDQWHLWGLVADVEVENDRYAQVAECSIHRLCLGEITGSFSTVAADEDAGGMPEPAC